MLRRKRDLWKVGIVLASVLFLLLFTIWVSVSTVHAQPATLRLAMQRAITVQDTPTEDATMVALQKDQLTQQVADGQHTFANWLWNNGVALVSILVIVVGGLIGYLRWVAEQQNARLLAQHAAETERQITSYNQIETAFQGYIDKMSELLLENHLHSSQPRDDVREIARVRTLTILPQLDAVRKKSVLRFLYESDLILTHNTIVDLSYVKLDGADLHRATFTGINLSKTNLRNADLSESELDRANLIGAKLEGADLTRANLAGANLSGANLSGICYLEEVLSLDLADLHGAKGLTKEQLEFCKARGATIDEDALTILPTQVSAPTPNTGGSSASSPKPSTQP